MDTNIIVVEPGKIPPNWYLPDSKSTKVTTYTVPQKVGSTINYPEITKSYLFANNIFTHSVLHDIYVHNIGYTLVRIHKLFEESVSTNNKGFLLSSFKYPVE